MLEAPDRQWDGVASPAGVPCVPIRRVGRRILAEARWRGGIDCAGLINWARAECRPEPIGGTKPDRERIGMTGSWGPTILARPVSSVRS